MVKLLSCTQGHFWESADTANGAGVQQAFCPVCGGIADSLPLLDLAPSELPAAPPPPPPALPVRDQAGRPVVAGYDILDDLGRGPTGLHGYRARQQGVGRNVLLHVSIAREDPGQLIWGSLRSESSALGKLSHPHIIQLLDVGERDRQIFYNVLEWIEGQPLARKMAEGPLPLPWVISLMETLARAVHYAHERGVVHRSLKPASIVLQITDKETGKAGTQTTLAGLFPRIVDWGLGRRPIEGDTCDLDLQGGLPFYLSPEQVWGRVKEIGPLCDVFALGAILFELLAGQPPHRAQQPSEVLDRIQSEEVPVPSAVAEGKFRSLARSAGDLEMICKKCLRKDPRRRYASALELADDLQRFARGKPIKAQPGGSQAQRAGWWLRRHTGAVLVAVLLIGSLIAVPIAYNAGKGAHVVPPHPPPRDETIRLRQELQQAQQALQMVQYARGLVLVQRDLDADLLPRALEQLNNLPGEQRHWEWHYLYARALRQNAQRKLLTCNSNVLALACSPGSRYLAVSAGLDPEQPDIPRPARGELHIWDLLTDQETNKLPRLTGVVRNCCFSPNTETLALISANVNFNIQSAEVLAWNVPDGPESWPQRVRLASGRTCSLAWAPNGRLLTLDRDGVLREIESFNGAVSLTRQTSPTEPWRDARANLPLAVCGGGGNFSIAALATDGQTIHVLDPWRNYSTTDLRGHTDRVTGLAGATTINRLASVSRDGTLRIWETPTGKEKQVLRGHHGQIINAVVFSADGKRVITCGQDNTIRVWEPHTGIEVLTLPMAEPNLSALALTQDGRQLVVAHGTSVSVLGPGR